MIDWDGMEALDKPTYVVGAWPEYPTEAELGLVQRIGSEAAPADFAAEATE